MAPAERTPREHASRPVAPTDQVKPARRRRRTARSPRPTAEQRHEIVDRAPPTTNIQHRPDQHPVHVPHERVGLDPELCCRPHPRVAPGRSAPAGCPCPSRSAPRPRYLQTRGGSPPALDPGDMTPTPLPHQPAHRRPEHRRTRRGSLVPCSVSVGVNAVKFVGFRPSAAAQADVRVQLEPGETSAGPAPDR